jgi:hypothetical protein
VVRERDRKRIAFLDEHQESELLNTTDEGGELNPWRTRRRKGRSRNMELMRETQPSHRAPKMCQRHLIR